MSNAAGDITVSELSPSQPPSSDKRRNKDKTIGVKTKLSVLWLYSRAEAEITQKRVESHHTSTPLVLPSVSFLNVI